MPTRSSGALSRRLVMRANAEREARNYPAAASLYEEALRLAPHDPRLFMQYGHMLKESGEFPAAEHYYLRAAAILPDDPDVAIQLGHFYKVAQRPDDARTAYLRAAALRPGWQEAEKEAAEVSNLAAAGTAILADALVPELLPREPARGAGVMREGIFTRRLGAVRIRRRGGFRRSFRGIEAIQGFAISATPLEMLTILVDGQPIRQERLEPASQLGGGQAKYVFNIWHDFSHVPFGPTQVELRASRAGATDLIQRSIIEIVEPVAESVYPQSDAIVGPFAEGERTLEDWINGRASMVRPARRSMLSRAPRAILVQRADQLGDLVCSIPALQRLRTLFPEARIVALVTRANADLAQTLDLLDDIVVIDFPEGADGHKSMPADAQADLHRKLTSYEFDIAIDLGETAESRPLLLLSGAPFLYGFKDRDFPWLSAGFELNTHDPGNYGATAATAHRLTAMIDALGAILDPVPFTVRRNDLDRSLLASYGIDPNGRYAVLHTGARLVHSRWPGFADLATLLLAHTDLSILVMGDEPLSGLPKTERIITITERLSFDAFDSLLSFCALFVGNDSGPKHLASLRGVPVISLHMARLNWNEWGQEPSGVIISRRVPCAGCGIAQDAENCGKGFACITQIRAEEVYAAAANLLAPPVEQDVAIR